MVFMAKQRGFTLMVEHYADLFQLDTSFKLTKDGVDLFLHVPVALEEERLRVYEFLPIPIRLSDDMFVRIEPQLPVIVVNGDQTEFRALSKQELSTCGRLQDQYLCDFGNTARDMAFPESSKQDEQLCTAALFNREFAAVPANCEIHILPSHDTVVQISTTEFIGFANDAHRGTIECNQADGTRATTSFTAENVYTKKLQPGCRAEVDGFKFTAGLSIHNESQWSVG